MNIYNIALWVIWLLVACAATGFGFLSMLTAGGLRARHAKTYAIIVLAILGGIWWSVWYFYPF